MQDQDLGEAGKTSLPQLLSPALPAPVTSEWVKAGSAAIKSCPLDFLPQLTDLVFLGNRLITEAKLNAQIDASKNAILRRAGAV